VFRVDAEKIALYRATVRRLEGQIRGLEERRKQLPKVFVGGLVLCPFSLLVSRWAPLWVLVATVSVVAVGYYIVLMHVQEDTAAIAGARKTIAELGGDPSEGVAQDDLHLEEPVRTGTR